jgi:hypothetical protein
LGKQIQSKRRPEEPSILPDCSLCLTGAYITRLPTLPDRPAARLVPDCCFPVKPVGQTGARLPFGDQIWARARAGQGPSLWQDMVSTSPFLTNNDMCRSSKYVLALDLGSHPSICSHGYPPPQKKQLYIYIYIMSLGILLIWDRY